MVIEWTPALAVGVPEIDAQLPELFRRAGRVVQALRGGRAAESVRLVSSLDDCASRHFAAQERLMERARYPGLARHAAAHAEFLAECRRRAAEVERAGASALLALTTHNWLSDWLRAHLGGEDRELARFLASGR